MNNMLLNSVFYVFAAITVLAALSAVIQKNPVRGVLFLVLAFFTSAVIWMLARAEFLSLILILVYVGAVMTLFLFVVMMLNIETEMKGPKSRYLPFMVLGAALFLALLLKALPTDSQTLGMAANLIKPTSDVSNTMALGMTLFTDELLGFEIAAMILLVAIIAAISLTHRAQKRSNRHQNVVQQIMTQKSERLSVVSMKAEKWTEDKA